MRILVGDIGGTKTALAIYEGPEGALERCHSARVPSADHPSLEAALRAFLDEAPGDGTVDRAAFAIAGPVADDRCETTNLPWVVDARHLEAALDIEHVSLLNDFAAVAHGVVGLGPNQTVVLQDGEVDPEGPIAILGAGTGLGEAILVRTAEGPRVLPTEGGHTDFAPRDDLEVGLLRFLLERYERVSVERVVSGMGLAAIYEFVVTRHLADEDPAVRARIEREDAGAVIGELALDGSDKACVRSVEIFVSQYGAEAGNLALKTLPTGGLFVAGGIAPKLLPMLTDGRFVAEFLRKGRMKPVLTKLRVAVVTEPDVGLLGALAYCCGAKTKG